MIKLCFLILGQTIQRVSRETGVQTAEVFLQLSTLKHLWLVVEPPSATELPVEFLRIFPILWFGIAALAHVEVQFQFYMDIT